MAFYISKQICALDSEIDEIVGHTYLYLKEQLELASMPPHSGILHGTIIGLASLLLLYLPFSGVQRPVHHLIAFRINTNIARVKIQVHKLKISVILLVFN